MGFGRQGDRQNSTWIHCYEMPKSKGHVFYCRLEAISRKDGCV